ncbi:MAG: hypothetical protein AAGF77_04180 [Bacteroidota bacterium]
MKVLNVHKRCFDLPKVMVANALATLSSTEDQLWPKDRWPAMSFPEGIQVGARGGHGPIRYIVEDHNPNQIIQFRFSKPRGFNGIHKFEIFDQGETQTMLIHTIQMTTTGKSTFLWLFGIRALHNALIEDGFDNLENRLLNKKLRTPWNFWVRFLRKQLAKR